MPYCLNVFFLFQKKVIANFREAFEINKEDHLAPILSYAASKVSFTVFFCKSSPCIALLFSHGYQLNAIFIIFSI